MTADIDKALLCTENAVEVAIEVRESNIGYYQTVDGICSISTCNIVEKGMWGCNNCGLGLPCQPDMAHPRLHTRLNSINHLLLAVVTLIQTNIPVGWYL